VVCDRRPILVSRLRTTFTTRTSSANQNGLGLLRRKTRPFQALISNLGSAPQTAQKILRESPKISRLFAMLIKPGSYPELQDSPRNPARHQILSRKKGGYVSTVSRRMSGFRGNSRTVISPIISPDPDSKPTISRTRLSTLNHRGKHRDRKGPDKPITRPSQRNKPRTKPR